MTSITEEYELQIAGLFAMFDATNNTEFLIQARQMVADGKIKNKGIDFEHCNFYDKSKYDCKCCRCDISVLKGNPIFYIKDRVLNKNKYWCVACATDDEKKSTFYINYAKKNIIDNSTAPTKSYQPNHPDADADGYLDLNDPRRM